MLKSQIYINFRILILFQLLSLYSFKILADTPTLLNDRSISHNIVINFPIDEISSKKEDVLSGKATVYIGDFKYEVGDDLSHFRLKIIYGSADFKFLTDAQELSSLTKIEGDADFRSLVNAQGLSSLRTIGRDANFYSLQSVEGLSSLEIYGKTIGNFWTRAYF